MAKGNMLLGQSRGSVGDVTFSTINGQQVARARNRRPANPRTLRQSYQRSRFSAAVKFFTRGLQAFYKFAFEGKRQRESDYNAFMRENVKRAPAISKAAFDNYDYPVVAPFLMSKGSLAPMDAVISGANAVLNLGVAAAAEAITTIGQLSQLLIGKSGFQAGDIITFVFIGSAYDKTYPSIEADGKGATKWNVRQFILDATSTALITEVTGMAYAAADNMATLKLAVGTDPLIGTLAGFTVVHSRNTDEGLKVSTQELQLNAAAVTAYEDMQEDAYKQSAAVTWAQVGAVDMQPDAILQGSIAYGQ